jgi:hypothetical protein
VFTRSGFAANEIVIANNASTKSDRIDANIQSPFSSGL